MYKIFLFLSLFNIIIFAKDFTFDEVLNLALKNNKDLKQQKYNVDITKENISMVKGASYGKLSILEEITRSNHSGYVFNFKLSSREAKFKDFGFSQMNQGLNTQPTDLNYPEDRTNFNTKITYDIPLFTGFKLSKQEEILNLQKKANELKYNLDKNQLSKEILKAYNGAVVAKSLIKAMEKAKEVINFVVHSANAFHKEGLVTKIDVKQAKVQEFNVNSQLYNAKNNYDLALAYLNFLTSSESITSVEELQNFNYDKELNLDNLYQIALKNRYEVKMQNINNNAMKKNIDIANSTYYPNVYSHLEYGFNDDKLNLSSKKDYYMAMIGLNYTLFDNTRKNKKQKSTIEYKKSMLNLEKLKDGIKLEVKKAILNLKAKEKILKEKKEAKVLANDVFTQSQLMYKNHLISMTNLLEQEANLRKNDTQYLVAQYEKSLAIADLLLALGNNLQGENK